KIIYVILKHKIIHKPDEIHSSNFMIQNPRVPNKGSNFESSNASMLVQHCVYNPNIQKCAGQHFPGK
ncbi:hypothetical protein P4S96_17410, partial [Aneurinibacillus thermoaerophilus]|uniref:hypothetical protein n=1 Tax=Aneurinibacillus thermoaerophilus TaxID=143495 RepID=UPI002E1B0F63|nr:hypothetical protein [Aneurinibacillus thermoaerophilus]